MSDYAKAIEKAQLLDYLFWDGVVTQAEIDTVAQAHLGWPTPEQQAEKLKQADASAKADAAAAAPKPLSFDMPEPPEGYVKTGEKPPAAVAEEEHRDPPQPMPPPPPPMPARPSPPTSHTSTAAGRRDR